MSKESKLCKYCKALMSSKSKKDYCNSKDCADMKKIDGLIWEANKDCIEKWRVSEKQIEVSKAIRAMYTGLVNGCLATGQQPAPRVLSELHRHESIIERHVSD